MATITDKFSKVSTGVRPVTTTVDGTRATSGATLSCADLTGWDTDTAVHGVTYKVDGQGAIVAGSQLDFKGIVSGNTITSFTVTGGTDAGNAVGDIVQATPTAAWAKDLADGLVVEHNQDGTHNFTDAFTDLTALTSADPTDVVPIVDVSTNTTKKVLVSGLAAAIADNIPADAIDDSQLAFGKVRSRQGGSATDWNTSGTTTYDVSATNTFMQCGARTITMNTTITFPIAYTNKPIVVATAITAGAQNSFARVNNITATTFDVQLMTSSTTGANSETVGWIAIGV